MARIQGVTRIVVTVSIKASYTYNLRFTFVYVNAERITTRIDYTVVQSDMTHHHESL